jgi:hypothetical protein
MTKDQEKEAYRELLRTESIPLMMQDWWMDAVCPDQWRVMLYEEEGRTTASFVYHLRHKYGLRFVLQPMLTQYSGLWMKQSPPEATDYTRLKQEKRTMTYFLDRLKQEAHPHFLSLNLHHSFTNHLPFHWAGFWQTTRYTYLIERIGNVEKCVEHFSSAKRRQIHKAEKQFTLNLTLAPDTFYALHKESLAQGGRGQILYDYPLFLRLWKAATARRQGGIFALNDERGIPVCAHFVVWDKLSAYDLLYFVRPDFAASGASSLIIREILQQLLNKTRTFDFEGSMDEGIENSYRQFGTRQHPYHHLTYSPLPLIGQLIAR